MTWYSKPLGDGIKAYGPTDDIQTQFMTYFQANGQPDDMAVFSLYDIEQNVVTVYFTPAAKDVALVFGAIPCEQPEYDRRLSLSVGDQRAWDIFYPDRPRRGDH